MQNELLYINTTNKIKNAIIEITDDKLLLSDICGHLKNELSIHSACYEYIEDEKSIMYTNISVEQQEISFRDAFTMFGNRYEICFCVDNNKDKIAYEFFEYLDAVIRFIIKNIKIKQNEIVESNIKEVKNVLNRLSFTELSVILKIFSENNCNDFTIVASKVAQKHNFTRSSIVNALRKLESAMIIESYSLGVKGTHIKVLNNYFRQEINKLN